jgi:uncharacterized protein YjiS (DUF1127 family)
MLSRQEIYRFIKEHGLQEAVKEKWASDYTRVSSEKLMQVIEAYNRKFNNNKTSKKPLNKVTPDDISDIGLRKAFIKLLSTLQTSETLYPQEVEEILSEL